MFEYSIISLMNKSCGVVSVALFMYVLDAGYADIYKHLRACMGHSKNSERS
jgi:hypothetical protein